MDFFDLDFLATFFAVFFALFFGADFLVNFLAANDPRIARLQEANSELRKEIAAMREHFDKQSQKQGVMSFKTVSMISKALHPDSKPSDHDRAEAFKAFSGWKADRNAAER